MKTKNDTFFEVEIFCHNRRDKTESSSLKPSLQFNPTNKVCGIKTKTLSSSAKLVLTVLFISLGLVLIDYYNNWNIFKPETFQHPFYISN